QMPIVGTPRSTTLASKFGAASSLTLEGPPESTMASGFFAANSDAGASWAMISEYRPASRMRRAMSWAYWAPKSTTRTGGTCVLWVCGMIQFSASAACLPNSGLRRLGDGSRFRLGDGPLAHPATKTVRLPASPAGRALAGSAHGGDDDGGLESGVDVTVDAAFEEERHHGNEAGEGEEDVAAEAQAHLLVEPEAADEVDDVAPAV